MAIIPTPSTVSLRLVCQDSVEVITGPEPDPSLVKSRTDLRVTCQKVHGTVKQSTDDAADRQPAPLLLNESASARTPPSAQVVPIFTN